MKVLLALLALAVVPASAAATSRARGSVEQVQVTGAKPGAQLALVNRSGKRVARQRAGPLGGAVFRDVKPGARLPGQRGKRVARAVSDRSAPPSTKLYKQKIPASGYGYLTTRDGTKLAIDVHLPGRRRGPYPTLVEYSGYGYANPAGARELDQPDRQPARLRGRRREHARHRLLGRRVRLLRAAAGPRRLRRDRDRRAPAVGRCTTRSG